MTVAIVVVVVVIVVLLGLSVMASYNRFVRQRNLVRESWQQIDVELTRRHDLIPNLVQTAQGYASFERSVLQSVTEARTHAVQAAQSPQAGPAEQGQAEAALGQALGRLFAVAESYPDLKASASFLELQKELANTEDRIAAGRRLYNGNVRELNTHAETFPASLVAGVFGIDKAYYFETEDAASRAPVGVDLSGLSQQTATETPG